MLAIVLRRALLCASTCSGNCHTLNCQHNCACETLGDGVRLTDSGTAETGREPRRKESITSWVSRGREFRVFHPVQVFCCTVAWKSAAASCGHAMLSFLVPAALALDNGLGRTPARGWNAWNSIRCEGLNENLIREVADAMVCQP